VVTVISRFKVRHGMEEEVRKAFLARPRLVESAPGFCGIEILTDVADASVFLVVTRWSDEESFRAWHGSEAHHASHALIPKGLKLDASFTSVTVGRSIHDSSGLRNLSEAIEGQSWAFSQWLQDSDAVFALLLAPDGAIHARNRAAERIFPHDPADNPGLKLWEYLVSSDVERLRERMTKPGSVYEGSFLLNLADGQKSPITWEAGLLRRGEAILLLGTRENLHAARFQAEIFNLTNALATMTREAARKNRELQRANETIEKLARIDALTDLSNRRMLEEALPREAARAERLQERLSLIFADLDRFKSINDRFGHKAGDQVLIRAGAVFKSQLRSYDVAARYGGDEFVLLLPGTPLDAALAVAERIRQDLAASEVQECPRQITASLGVAGRAAGEAAGDLLARADAALYRAKQMGGNRVESASAADVSDRERRDRK